VAAENAFLLDPNQIESSVLLATVLELHERHDEARRLLEALVARRPASRIAWRELAAHAKRQRDRTLLHYAQRRSADLLARPTSPVYTPRPRPTSATEVDRALRASQLSQARRLARSANVSAGELAARAAALGRSDLALQQSALVLAADPTDADAWVASLVAADLTGDAVAFNRAIRRLSENPSRPGSLAARLLAELLERRLGSAAAEAWLAGYGPLPEPLDELESAIANR
jgi:predicted nucleic acid-binding protein